MRKTTFIFAGIISAVIGTAFAAGENTVTSKSYVDTQDALKQNKLHTASATPANNGATVVTYTDTEGTPGERGIFDYDTGAEYDEDTGEYIGIAEGREGDLVTAGDVIDRIEGINSDLGDINDQLNNMPSMHTSELVCANAPDCTLWTIQGQYALQGQSPKIEGQAQQCTPNGSTASSASQCCSKTCLQVNDGCVCGAK